MVGLKPTSLAVPNRAFYQLNYTRIFDFLHDTTQGKKKQVFRVCGQCCGQARFCESFSAGEFPPQATVPRPSGVWLLEEWMARLSSQSKRATNCATPGYEIFQLWSNMWSTPIFDQLSAREKVLSAQVSQGFPGFPRVEARTRASRSQITRAANYATFGHRYFSHPGAFFPTYVRQYTLRSAALALWHHLLLDRGQHDGFILYLSILPVSPPKSSLFASGRYVGKAVRRLWGLRTA